MNGRKIGIEALAAVLVATFGVACSPAFDWREFTPEGGALTVRFPCRPDQQQRVVALAGAPATMQMLVCSAGDATFALSSVNVADPARVGAALAELRSSALRNVQGRDPRVAPLRIDGMTPNDQAMLMRVEGRLPNGGAAVEEHAAFFVRGLQVYQATVIGAKPPAQAVETFFGALRFRS